MIYNWLRRLARSTLWPQTGETQVQILSEPLSWSRLVRKTRERNSTVGSNPTLLQNPWGCCLARPMAILETSGSNPLNPTKYPRRGMEKMLEHLYRRFDVSLQKETQFNEFSRTQRRLFCTN